MYHTTIENLEEASLYDFVKDAFPDQKVVDVSKISEKTKENLFNDLISRLRHDPRLEEPHEHWVFYTKNCNKSDVLSIEEEYHISLIDDEEALWDEFEMEEYKELNSDFSI
jgi:hypothetical protein